MWVSRIMTGFVLSQIAAAYSALGRIKCAKIFLVDSHVRPAYEQGFSKLFLL